jgi:hypothetical protein
MNELMPVITQVMRDTWDERHREAQTFIAAGCWNWVEAGKRYAQNKQEAKGYWATWCEEKGIALSTTDALVKIAERFDGKLLPGRSVNIDFRAMRLLASPKVPEDTVAEAISRAETGEHITKEKAQEMVDAAVRDAIRRTIEEAARRQDEAVFDATKPLIEEVRHLKGGEVTLQTITANVREMLGLKELTSRHYRLIAQVIGKGITHNGTVYPALSEAEERAIEQKLRMTSVVVEGLQALAGAPPPDVLLGACMWAQRETIRDLTGTVITWLQQCEKDLREYPPDEGRP